MCNQRKYYNRCKEHIYIFSFSYLIPYIKHFDFVQIHLFKAANNCIQRYLYRITEENMTGILQK